MRVWLILQVICLDLFWTFCRSSFSIHGSEAKRYLQRWKFSNCGYFWSLRRIDMYSWTPGYFYLGVFLEIKISLPFHLQFLPSVTSNCQRNYLVRRNFVPHNQLLTTFFLLSWGHCVSGITKLEIGLRNSILEFAQNFAKNSFLQVSQFFSVCLVRPTYSHCWPHWTWRGSRKGAPLEKW